jgi:hypothetical protein
MNTEELTNLPLLKITVGKQTVSTKGKKWLIAIQLVG